MSNDSLHAQQARSTLRLQLHARYTMDDACRDLPYFARLGVTHLYLSPITQSRPGSTHGYDVIDHGRVDEERGGEAALRRLSRKAQEHGLGLLLDIVPNHMATHPGNAWWWDVLTFGRDSVRAGHFDIDWEAGGAEGRILAPFLARPLDEALSNGDVVLQHSARFGLHVAAHGQPWPLSPESLGRLGMQRGGGPADPAAMQACLADHDAASADGRDRLQALLAQQHYRLEWWRRAADSINWRRFFEVSDLIGVRVEDEVVFDEVHQLVLRLYAEGVVDGLRIDHVDGLARPLAYCRRLHEAMATLAGQRLAGRAVSTPWLVVEKILAPGEVLDERWVVSGTTGYDFAADAGAVLHEGAGEALLSQAWAEVAGDARPCRAWLLEARQEMLDRHFIAERRGLLNALHPLQERKGEPPDTALAHALNALLRNFPTYRSYVEDGPRLPSDQRWFDQARQAAAAELAAQGNAQALACLPWLDEMLGGRAPDTGAGQRALTRFQQLTPPLAAKSLEDTVFYRYGRLLSRNEVGSDPAVLALGIEAFHQGNLHRAQRMSQGLLATATHDHKRGEDARARLAVLSEIPEAWWQQCRRWMQMDEGQAAGDTSGAFRYMLLQTLVAAWPPQLSPSDRHGMERLLDRVAAFSIKALREGKQLSGWFEPQEEQEAGWQDWLQAMTPGGTRHALAGEIAHFVAQIEPGAVFNGLVQTALRLCCPGVPDTYQGTEWRDFSLVDPDNRVAVDHSARARALNLLDQALLDGERVIAPLAPGFWPAQAWTDGRVKQALIATLLALRKSRPAAFCGGYQPLQVDSAWPGHVLAFARGGEVVLVAAVKCASGMRSGPDGAPFMQGRLEGSVEMPGGNEWVDVLRRRTLRLDQGRVHLADLLGGLPLAVLLRVQG